MNTFKFLCLALALRGCGPHAKSWVEHWSIWASALAASAITVWWL